MRTDPLVALPSNSSARSHPQPHRNLATIVHRLNKSIVSGKLNAFSANQIDLPQCVCEHYEDLCPSTRTFHFPQVNCRFD